MSWWKNFLGQRGAAPRSRGKDAPEAPPPPPPPTPPPPKPAIRADDRRIGAGRAQRLSHWRRFGLAEREPLTYADNSDLHGAPDWPAGRKCYHVIHRYDSLILTTDGLSDPFVGTTLDSESGYGVEVFLEIPENVAMPFDEVRESWAFALLEIVSQNIAGFGGIADRLAREEVVLMSVPVLNPPSPDWVDEIGYTGVLIGLPARRVATEIALPLGPVRFTAVTLLRPDEAAFAQRGRDERADIAEALKLRGYEHFSDPSRPSVL